MIQKILSLSILITVFTLGGITESKAEHIYGGNIGYSYEKDTLIGSQTQHIYNVIMTVYYDCNDRRYPFTRPETIAIYEGPLNATSLPNSSKVTNLTLFFQDSTTLQANIPNGCSFTSTVCVGKIRYQNRVVLPSTFTGYHFIWDRCCRQVLTNISGAVNTVGSLFHSWTATTATKNSSPQFRDLKRPFLCANQEKSIVNLALDVDGNQLNYEFYHPFDGEATSGAVNHTAGYTTWPPTTVTYNPGFNVNQPFGPTGSAAINGLTGLASLKAPTNTGEYVVGVKVKEIDQNGFTIGLVHREFQFPVISCIDTNTHTPSLVSGSSTSHTIEEGDSLCFDIEFESTGANLGFEYEVIGEPFQSPTNPRAVLGAPQFNGKKSKQRFCWNTSCTQGRKSQYFFTATMADSACFPGDTSIVYSIDVKPFEGPKQIIGATNLCSGSKGEIYSTDTISGATYTWSVTGGNIVGSSNGPSITVDWNTVSGGNISVVANSKFGCPSDPINQSILLKGFDIFPGPDRTICLGDTTTLGSITAPPTAPNGFSIKWSPSLTIDNDTVQNPKAFPNTTTTYVLTVVDTSGLCTEVDSVTVTVLQNLNAGIRTNDTSICEGNQVQLEAFGGRFYKWIPSSGVSNDTIFNPLTTINSTTTFICEIRDTGTSCNRMDTVTITVDKKDDITAGLDTSICLGETYQLGKLPNGSAGSKYKWTPNTFISNDTIANPVFTPVSAGTNTYELEVTTPAGCIFKDTVTIQTDTVPVLILEATSDTICSGESDTLNVRGANNYTWLPSTLPQNQSFQFIKPTTTTTYIVTGTDLNSCSATDSIEIVVNPSPEITIPHDSIFLCLGDSVQLTATPGALGYTWTPNTNISPSNTVSNPFVKPSSSTMYSVAINNFGGCNGLDSIFVLVDDSVPTDAGLPKTICVPDTIQIGGAPTALGFRTTFVWVPGGKLVDSTVANPLTYTDTVTKYYVLARNGNCIGFDSVIVSVAPKPTVSFTNSVYEICANDSVLIDTASTSGTLSSFSWSPTSGLSDTNSLTPKASPSASTVYTLSFTNAQGCAGETKVTVNVTNNALINAGNDTITCVGTPIQLQATGGVKYTWSPGNLLNDSTIASPVATISSTTTFVVNGENGLGCKGSDTVIVSLKNAPIIDAGGPFIICSDTVNKITLGGNPTGPNGSVYSWSSPQDLDNPSIANPTTSLVLARTYIVLVKDTNGCVAVDSAEVRPFSFKVNSPTAECNKDTIQLEVTQVNGTTPFKYKWTPNYNLSNDTISNPIANPDSSVSYTVVVTDSNGCIDSAVSIVNISENVTADFDLDIVASCDNALARTINKSSNAVTYQWIVDNRLYSQEYDIEIPLNFNQAVNVTLIASNGKACVDSASFGKQALTFADYFDGTIPNVFTPNDDGVNDVFDVQLGQRLEQCSDVRIYNRWGVLIYQSRENDHTWDGRTFTGDKCVQGVYFYVLTIHNEEYRGQVTLIRD